MCITVNWWYLTVVIEGELCVWHFGKDVHNELKTSLFEVFLALLIQVLN